MTPKEANAKNTLFQIIKQYPLSKKVDNCVKSKSAVVWLASYPRSGNTMLRGWLKKNFEANSCSIYNDLNDIGSEEETSSLVGHYMVDWPFSKGQRPNNSQLRNLEEHQNYSGNVFIKTHACFQDGYSLGKTIYILRNGIDALTSHIHYRQDFGSRTEKNIEKEFISEFEKVIINGLPTCGYWSDNVISWLDYYEANKDSALLLRFEDLIKDVRNSLGSIRDFTGSFLITEEPYFF